MLKKYLEDTSGATAVEYGLLIGLFALFLVTSASLLGSSIKNFFLEAGESLDGA